MGIWNPRHNDVNRYFVFLGRSQQNGARAPRGTRLFARNIQPRGPHYAPQDRDGLRPSINWQFLAYIILTLGETMVSITGLEFSYTQAPNTMKSSVMALWLFTVAFGEFFVGKFNAWDLNADGTRKLTDYQYFTFFTVLMFVAAVVFVVVACFYKGRTYLQTQQPTLDEIATEPILHGGSPS